MGCSVSKPVTTKKKFGGIGANESSSLVAFRGEPDGGESEGNQDSKPIKKKKGQRTQYIPASDLPSDLTDFSDTRSVTVTTPVSRPTSRADDR